MRGARVTIAAAVCLLLGFASFTYAGAQTDTSAARQIKGRTIVSTEFPKAELTVHRGLRFIGTQQINLYGNAEAEQYVFAKAGSDKTVQRFYLIQFEHSLPTSDHTYNYSAMHPTQISNLPFNYDVKAFPDLAGTLMADPKSDGAGLVRLLATQHISLPEKTAFVRMFHLPSADHRTELMIIYGEALPQDTAIPVRKDGAQLDTEAPDAAKIFLQHALQGFTLQPR